MRARLNGSRRLLLAIVGVAVACGGSDGPSLSVQPPDPTPVVKPAAVSVTFDSSYVRAGSTVTAKATALDASGAAMTGVSSAQWSVEGTPGVATISQTGTVTTLAAGVAVIVARIDGVRGENAIVVRPAGSLAQVVVRLDSSSLLVGSSTAAHAVQLDSAGEVVTSRPVTWSLRGTAGVATISAIGVVTAIAPGTVTVVANAGGVEGEAQLQVVAPSTAPVARVVVTLDAPTVAVGRSTQARVQALDAAGKVLVGKSVAWSMAPGSVSATVSSTGLVTSVAVGSASVVGTVDQVTGSATLTIVDSGSTSGLVQLPTLPRDSVVLSYPTVRGRTWTVKAGDNLQNALNAAQRGDEVVLQAGATFTGNFILPTKPGTAADGWILVRSDMQTALPPFGARVGPANASLMPQLLTINASAALQTASGASGWWVTGLEMTIASSFTAVNYGLVLLGDGSSKQNSLALVPSDIVLDRVYIHAQPTVGTSRCVGLNSARTAIVDSYLDHCHLKGYDSQAIAGWNGPGPFRIENNALYGAGENVMFGGSDPAIRDLIPSDIIFRRNHVYTPATWKSVWTKKNLFETKNVQRLLIEENVFDGSWADAQVGFAFVFKSANQGGGCTWCASRDITFRYNLVRNVGAGFNLAAREGSSPYPVGELMTRVLIDNNVMENVDVAPYSGVASVVQVLNNISHLTIQSNTFTSPSSSQGQFLNLGTNPAATSFSFTRNIVSLMKYGLFASGLGAGTPALQAIRAPLEYKDVVVIAAQRPSVAYPPTTTFVTSLTAAQALPNMGADEARVRAVAQVVVLP